MLTGVTMWYALCTTLVIYSSGVYTCPTSCHCSKLELTYVTVECPNLRAVPQSSDYPEFTKEIRLTLEGNPGIPARAFADVPDIVSIRLSGDIGHINGDAFSLVTTSPSRTSTLTFSGRINSVNTAAFRHLTQFDFLHFEHVIINTIKQFAFDNSHLVKIEFMNATINRFSGFAFGATEVDQTFVIKESRINQVQTCSFSGVKEPSVFEVKSTTFQDVQEYAFADVTMREYTSGSETYLSVQRCTFKSVSPTAFSNMRAVGRYEFTSNSLPVHLQLSPAGTKPDFICHRPSNIPPPTVPLTTAGFEAEKTSSPDPVTQTNTATEQPWMSVTSVSSTTGLNTTTSEKQQQDVTSSNKAGGAAAGKSTDQATTFSTLSIILIIMAVVLLFILVVLVVAVLVRKHNIEGRAVEPVNDNRYYVEDPDY